MRRKSERNKNKSSPEKKIVETPPPAVRKSKRHSRKQQRSPSEEESDDDAMKTGKSPEQITPTKSPSNSDDEPVERPIWKVQTADSASGEIQKIKICLTRPTPTTPERREKSPRRKRHKSANHEGEGEERSSRKSRRRGSSAVTNLEDSMSNSNSQESQEDEGKFNKDKTEAHEILQESVHDTSEPVQAQILSQNEPKSGSELEEIISKVEQKVEVVKPVEEEEQSKDVNENSGNDNTEEMTTPDVERKKNESGTESSSAQEEVMETKSLNPEKLEKVHIQSSEIEESSKEVEANDSINKSDETVEEVVKVEAAVESKINEAPEKVVTTEEEIELQQSVAVISKTSEEEQMDTSEVQSQPEITSKPDSPEIQCKDTSNTLKEQEEINEEEQDDPQKSPQTKEQEIEEIIEESTSKVLEEKTEVVEEEEKEQGKIVTAKENIENLNETVEEKDQCKVVKTKKTVRIMLEEEKEQCEIINKMETEDDVEGWQVIDKKEIDEIVHLEREASKKKEEQMQAEKRRLVEEKQEEQKSERIVKKKRRSSDETSSDSSSESSDDNIRRKTKHVQKDRAQVTTPKDKPENIVMEKSKLEVETLAQETVEKEVETPKKEVETHVSDPFPEKRERNWINVQKTVPKIRIITSETIKTICPNVEMVPEDQVRLEVKSTEKRRESKTYERKVSIEQKDDVNKGSYDSEEVSANVISMNRKISIVDDEASKLQPPPQPAKHPVSAVLYITNLVRPFTLKQLKELLSRTGNIMENGFWTDRIKSKCYVQYENEE